MIEIKAKNRRELAGLLEGHLGGYIPNAILEGHMGRVVADKEMPQFAVLELPAVKFAILGGDSGHPLAREYLQNLPGLSMLLFASDGFASIGRDVHPGKWVDVERYAFSSEQLDIEKLREFKSRVPNGLRIERIDLALAKRLTERANKFAEKLGYTPQGAYPMSIFTGSKFLVPLRNVIQGVKRFFNISQR